MPSLESVWTVGLVKVLVLSKPSYEDLFKWVLPLCTLLTTVLALPGGL